jgi:hypothetical protein
MPPSTRGVGPAPCRYTRASNVHARGLRRSAIPASSRQGPVCTPLQAPRLPGRLSGHPSSASSTAQKPLVVSAVAENAGAWVLTQRPSTAISEPWRMGVDPPAQGHGGIAPGSTHPTCCVTRRAVALGVTAGTGVQGPLGFPGVVAGRARPVGPDRFGGMKAAAFGEVAERPARNDPCSLMATQAERLLSMTARATRSVLACCNRVE